MENNAPEVSTEKVADIKVNPSTTMTSTFSSSGPLSPGTRRGIRDKVLNLEAEINRQQMQMEEQNKEIKRLHRMLDPLRLSLQSYTDQSESRIIRMQEKIISDQREKNTQLNDELSDLKLWKVTLEGNMQSIEKKIENVTNRLANLGNELFGEEN